MDSLIKIGVLTGKDDLFSYDLIEKINNKGTKFIKAELCKLAGIKEAENSKYSIIIDRISHLIPFYSTYLKNAIINGTYVINNPFWINCTDKFLDYKFVLQQNIPVPPTVCLPCIKTNVSTINWDEIIEYIGFPIVLKSCKSNNYVYKINNIDKLLEFYNNSNNEIVLQKYINYEYCIRVFVCGKKYINRSRFDPETNSYLPFPRYIEDKLFIELKEHSIKLSEIFGYDLNLIEFIIKDNIPYFISIDPIPDLHPYSIGNAHFSWIVDHMTKTIIEILNKKDIEKKQLPDRFYVLN